MERTKIIVEASVLAMAEERTDARTGIYFSTKNICEGLLLRKDVELKFFILSGDGKLNELLMKTYAGTHFNDCLDISMVRMGEEKLNFLMPFFPAPATLYNVPMAQVFQVVNDFAFHACPELSNIESERMKNGIGFEKMLINSMDSRGFAICISKNTRNDLIKIAGYNPERSDFFYPGLKREITNGFPGGGGGAGPLRLLLNLPETAKYILVLSTVEPRKNIGTSLKVFQEIIQSSPSSNLYFVIVGDLRYWNNAPAELECLSPEVRERIRLTGYVTDNYLPDLYREALCLLYPSFYEGFGMPLVEAMACGTPVVTSNRGSIPEVVDEAIEVFDAYDYEGMAQKIVGWYMNPESRRQDGAKAYERSKYFTWDKAIDRIVNFIKQKSA